MSFDDILTLVVDTGSKTTKAGFAGESFPRAVLPTVVGRFRHQGLISEFPEIFFGNEAIKNRGLSKLTWPVQDGFIKNWDEVEKLWFHIFFRGLHVPPEQCRILYSVHPLVPKGDRVYFPVGPIFIRSGSDDENLEKSRELFIFHRERMCEILFESFAIDGLNLVKSPVLALHASGRTTGLVYENGACSSYVTPIYEGFPLLHTAAACELTGEALTNKLGDMMANIGYSFTTPLEKSLLDVMKAKICFVARNYKEECDNYDAAGENPIKYELPDGQHILIGKERFKCCEALFQPSLVGLTCPSIIDYICDSIEKCDTDIRHTMFDNIVISGGSTMFPGFAARLHSDLMLRLKTLPVDGNKTVFIDELPSRQNIPWVGGSMIASLDNLRGFWMTKQEYSELGPDRVNYKFF